MRRPKYLNRKTVVDGVTFDSRAEARRWHELLLLQGQGEIADLRRQVSFELVRGVRFPGAPRATPALRYIADFQYRVVGTDEIVVEDVKSAISKQLPAYRIKRHLMFALFGIVIKEIT